MKKTKLLITGASGFLGLNLCNLLRGKYEILAIYNKNNIKINNIKKLKIDLKNKFLIKKIIKSFNPNAIIHCAAISNIEYCEKKKQESYNLNVGATKNILENLKLNQKFIFISSDHLFAGKKKTYDENSKVNPINQYAKTKVLCERLIKKNKKNHLILRTNFFGKALQKNYSFADWIYQSLLKRKKIGLFNDVYFSPLHITTIAYCINFLIKHDKQGTFNLSSTQSLNKYDFGIELANSLNLNTDYINEISKKDLKFLVKRPNSMVLSNKKIKKLIKKNIFNISYNLNKYINEII